METIVYSSNKGGTGKSSISLNTAGYLGLKNRILFIGLDGQKNSTNILKSDNTSNTIYEVLQGKCDIQDAIYPSQFKGVSFVPESRKMDDIDVSRMALKKLTASIYGNFDYVIIDCPPALNTVVYSAYNSADNVVIPTELDKFSSDNLVHVINTIQSVNSKATINVLPNKVVSNSKLHKKIKGELESYINTKDNVTIGESLPNSIEISNQMFEGKLLTLSNKFNKLKYALKNHTNKDVR